MKIQLVSDLHIEFSSIDIVNKNNADVLILSGDIINLTDLTQNPKKYLKFFDNISKNYQHIIYVMGNHESYRRNYYNSIFELKEIFASYPNIHFLNNDHCIINDVVFIGGTLWTDCNKNDPLTKLELQQKMNDYRLIFNEVEDRRLTPDDTIGFHYETLFHFKKKLDQYADKKVVMVTHHTPSKYSIDPRYQHDHLMNGGYFSDLTQFIKDHPQIKLWTCGHTHHAHRYYIDNTLVACNPRGYESYDHSEDTGFNQDRIIDLDNMPDIDVVDYDFNWQKL